MKNGIQCQEEKQNRKKTEPMWAGKKHYQDNDETPVFVRHFREDFV